ncbi:MAG: H-NS family nucleoid-associated regulatory protein [Desulfopila sp.]
MEDFLQIIGHARRLKSATKKLSVNELTDIMAKLQKIIDDRLAAEEKIRQEEAEKIEKIEKYREMLAVDGIALDELVAESTGKREKRAPRPPKYEIIDDNGKRVTWTGQGRMPNVFKERVDAGDSIDSFLIN